MYVVLEYLRLVSLDQLLYDNKVYRQYTSFYRFRELSYQNLIDPK